MHGDRKLEEGRNSKAVSREDGATVSIRCQDSVKDDAAGGPETDG